jgi:predicted phage terminase large subunit-like protein
MAWKPNPGPQTKFHSSNAYEVLYGGAAGGGKTESLLMESLRYIHVPGYAAVLFRRTFGELRQANGLIERSRVVCPKLGGKFNEQEHIWRFEGGGVLMFSHLEHAKDRTKHDSAEYAFVGFDELHTFLESQYDYLGSRVRTTAIDPSTGKVVPARIRAATNPPFTTEGMWVKERFFDKLIPFEVKHFAKIEDVDTEVPKDHPNALSRVFIPAKVFDNKVLMEADPGYIARLENLPFIDRMRLLKGLWDVPVKGNVFKREWFDGKILKKAPEGLKWVRFWDLAISLKTKASFTASAAVAVDAEANLYIRDMLRFKKQWPQARIIMKSTILDEDHIAENGVEAKLHGEAAVQDLNTDVDLLNYSIIPTKVTVDKLVRALPWSAKAEQGKVFLVDGPWVKGALDEFEVFDGLSNTYDDQVDAVSGGVQMLAGPKWSSPKFMHLAQGLRL